MRPKSQGTNGLNLIKKSGNTIPKNTPRGASMGIVLSKNRFILTAAEGNLLLKGIRQQGIGVIITDAYQTINRGICREDSICIIIDPKGWPSL
jgi:predicted methyltransferase